MSDANHLYRAIPAMDVLLKAVEQQATEANESGWSVPDAYAGRERPLAFSLAGVLLPRSILRSLTETYLQGLRERIRNGAITALAALETKTLLPELIAFLRHAGRPHFRRVLNATGVVIHTNLGRSLLAEEAVQAVQDAAVGYSNLEFDLTTGERGSRYSHVTSLITSLTGAEAAIVVNNNAAAVLLVLDSLCSGKEVIVSRGQLVEIGGSFRIPDVMRKSGGILKEIGTTNRVHPADYIDAVTPETGALLYVHTSNYRVIGFHSEVSLHELAAIAHERELPLLEDLGSGNLCDFNQAGLPELGVLASDEPTVQKCIADGADIVTFSGDKVLGGPQAGIIAGKRELIARIAKNPLNRALRVDKMTLAALEATLRLYTDPELARRRIPTLRMLCTPPAELSARAAEFCSILRQQPCAGDLTIDIKAGTSLVGGGAFPERTLATRLVSIKSRKMDATQFRLELMHVGSPYLPLVCRIEYDALCLDMRTLNRNELEQAAESINAASGGRK